MLLNCSEAMPTGDSSRSRAQLKNRTGVASGVRAKGRIAVLVQLSGDRPIIGYLRYYSDEPEDASLFLEVPRGSWTKKERSLRSTDRKFCSPSRPGLNPFPF